MKKQTAHWDQQPELDYSAERTLLKVAMLRKGRLLRQQRAAATSEKKQGRTAAGPSLLGRVEAHPIQMQMKLPPAGKRPVEGRARIRKHVCR